MNRIKEESQPRSPDGTILLSGLFVLSGIFLSSALILLLHADTPKWVKGPLPWGMALVSLLLLSNLLTWRTVWRAFFEYSTLAVLGQFAALSLIKAPNYGVLQYYLQWKDIFSFPYILILIIPITQSVLVALWLYRHRLKIIYWYKALFNPYQVLIIIAVLGLAAANFSRDPSVYFDEVLLSALIMGVNLITLIIAVICIPTEFIERFIDWGDLTKNITNAWPQSFWVRKIHWLIALWVLVICGVIAWYPFERVPHIPDDLAFLFQAKIFASGRLSLPPPPDSESFKLLFVINDGTKWYTYAFLGWPLVLAIGVLLGLPWLINPVLASITILLTYWVAQKLYTKKVALFSIFLLGSSPWFLFMSGSYMTHPVTLVWTLLAIVGVIKTRETGNSLWAWMAGISLGALFLTRPLEGVTISIVIFLWALGLWGKRINIKALAGLVIAACLVGGLHLVYNAIQTGNPFYFPVERYFDEEYYPGANGLGFGPNKGNVGWEHIDPIPGHGLFDIVINTNQNLYLLNFETFGWISGSLIFLLMFIVWWKYRPPDKILLAIMAITILGSYLYFFSGVPDFGARYWYQLLIPVTILTVRGVEEIQFRWKEGGGSVHGKAKIATYLFLASLVSLLTFVPWRGFGKYVNYRGMRSDVNHIAERCNFGKSLVIVRGIDKSDYPSAFVYNPVDLNAPVPIYVREINEDVTNRIRSIYSDRPVWVIEGSNELGGEFRIVESPAGSDRGC